MEGRESDVRVPLISGLFCVLLITGGVFLALHVFVPRVSRPWFQTVALVLIASPWMFWSVTFLYVCAKRCYRWSWAAYISRRPVSRSELSPAATANDGCGKPATHADEISVAYSGESEKPLTGPKT